MFFEEIREKQNCCHKAIKSKKKMFIFENMSRKEQKQYMQETNLKDINISTMDINQFRSLSKDTQKAVMQNLIDKYQTNTEIAKNTLIKRRELSRVRATLNLEPSKRGRSQKKVKELEQNKNTPVVGEEKPLNPNVAEIEIYLQNYSKFDLQKKLDTLMLLLDENRKYDIDFVIKEK